MRRNIGFTFKSSNEFSFLASCPIIPRHGQSSSRGGPHFPSSGRSMVYKKLSRELKIHHFKLLFFSLKFISDIHLISLSMSIS